MQLPGKLSRAGRAALALAVTVAGLAAEAGPLEAQYFGRNKVQFDDFDFKVLTTDHFDFHYYPEEGEAIEDAARMGERWYERFARTFQHDFEARKPVILYADHPDFQQTNTLSGFINEGTGGVTESLKNRVIMPLTGSYSDTDHVLGHELVHAFQYNIAQSRRGGGLQGLVALPLWLVEGMAEYLSVGRDDPLTAMWIRDAIRRDELPTIRQMTRETRFFPYRFGQALWAYVGGTWGDDAVVQIYRRSLRVGFEGAIRQVLGMPSDTLSVRWREKVAEEYMPLMEGREAPSEQGRLLLGPATGSGGLNVSPAVSPDGRYVAFLAQNDLFSTDLYLAETATGKIVRKLASASSSGHVQALRYIDSSGTWSPDGKYFAFVITAGGDHRMRIVDVDSGSLWRELEFPGIGSATTPAWSPDGRTIAFSGMVGGISDLYLYDLDSEEIERLTDDRHADVQPAWSPDGRTLAFVSDRGPETDFDRLTYSSFRIAFLDLPTRAVQTLSPFGNVKHMNPQYAPDGRSLYFISDRDGFSDIYQVTFSTGEVRRVTRLATAVSGITYMSPAMSVANDTGTLVYSIFDQLQFHIYTKDAEESTIVTARDEGKAAPGRKLPPAEPEQFSRVATYLADATTGLPEPKMYPVEESESYRPSLGLDYVGQPTLGVGTDQFGSYVGGGGAAFFTDMLGDKLLGVTVQAQGTFKDIGGQVFYADLSDRWNWAVGVSRIPFLLGNVTFGSDERGDFIGQQRLRVFISSLTGQISYPFNQSQRVEFNGSYTRYGFDLEIDKYFVNEFGQIVDFDRQNQNELEPDALNLAQGSVALVGDNSFFGFVSPIRGQRYRLEVEQTVGDVDFTTVTADYRRYFQPDRNLTIGFRALHIGRYSLSEQESGVGANNVFGVLSPLFLGFETLVRGYAFESFDGDECSSSFEEAGSNPSSTCPAIDRLVGQRLGVANLEVRVPLFGVPQFGLFNFPFIPTEITAFTDAGLAWDSDNDPVIKFSRSSSDRIPVFSSGFGARFNILGIIPLEAYYAYPYQRPDKGWHWGFVIAPGW